MPWVGFEPTAPAFEWAKTVHALDRAAIVLRVYKQYKYIIHYKLCFSWIIQNYFL
jgi:hypothetical protein